MNQKTDKLSTPSDLEKKVVEPSNMEPTENQIEPNKWKQVRGAAKDNIKAQTENDQSNDLDETTSDLNNEVISKEQFKEAAKAYLALQEENKNLKEKLAEAEKTLQYSEADKQNSARRYREELEKTRLYAGSDTIGTFVSLLDSLEAASLQSSEATLEQLKEGSQNILDLVHSIFKKLGVSEVNSAIGEVFDPNLHSAVATEAAESPDQPSDVIIKVLRKGYLLHERVIRPAMVVISETKE